MQKAVEKVQTDKFVPDVEAELMYFYSQRSKSMQHMVKFKEDEPSRPREVAPGRRIKVGVQPNVRLPPPEVPQRDRWWQAILPWCSDQGP